jgi:octaprenyl-diphosphate synthase
VLPLSGDYVASSTSSVPEDFLTYLSEAKRQVDEELRRLISSLRELKLHPQMAYAALSQGKRLRPILVLMSGEAVGGRRAELMPLALAFELIHTATLVHDDIIDGDLLRRGVPTLYQQWKDKAILGGDALFVHAINLVAGFGPEVMKNVCRATLEVCDGEFMDVSLNLPTATEEEYLLKIRKKSASLFGTAAQCGCMAGGGTDVEVKALATYGEFFGMAYQVSDDLHELETEKTVPSDLKNRRVILPYIHLYRHGSAELRNLLKETFERRTASLSDAAEIFKGLEEFGSLAYCRRKIKEYAEVAEKSLAPLRNNQYKDYLHHLLRYFT